MSFDDTVNGIARPVIGFLLGMAAGHLVELAGTTGWWDRFFDRFGWGTGGMTAKYNAHAGKSHRFVRFGWVFGLIFGFAAVFILPEGALSWL